MITKYSVTDNETLRQECVKYDWFTEGTNSQYEKLFYANEHGCPLDEIATIIWLCSDNDRWPRDYSQLPTFKKVGLI